MNYKKSLLSLVTIMALGNMAVADDAATYLPLSSTVTDSVWTLFGVNGFSNGVASTVSTSSSSFSAGLTELEDTVVTDEMATAGLSSGGNLASLQALLPATSPVIASLSVGVDLTGTAYEATEAVRSIYMKVGSSTPNVKFNYKASLEGKAIQILLNGTLYSATITESSTWANALTATLGSGAVVTATDKVKTVTGVLDFNMTNNPVEAKYFDASTHLLATGATASFYHFNALTQQWEVNQKGAPTAAQDFTSFTAGKAYWGRADRVDALGGLNPDQDGATGLILGTVAELSGIPDPAMYQDESNVSTLTAGWNMLSFDDHKPYIRHAATGLVLTAVANTDKFIITDDSGLNSITTAAIAAAGNHTDAIAINKAIESAKLLGTLPQTFNIKVFQGSAAGTMVFISDRKFSVSTADIGGGVGVTTLNAGNPFVNGVQAAVVDLNATSALGYKATSAYGEYATIVQTFTGAGTSSAILTSNGADATGSKLKFASTDTTGGSATANILTNIGTAETNIEAIAGSTPTATQIDTDFDGTADMLIVAHSVPYTLEDNTYTRVFARVGAVDGNVTVSGSAATTVSSGISAATLANNIHAVAATSLIDANATTVTATETVSKIVAVTNSTSSFDIKDTPHGVIDVISASTTTTNFAKGAVGGVYSLDGVARLPLIQHSFVSPQMSTTYIAAALDTNVTINATTTTVTAPALGTTAATRLAYFNALVAGINTIIQTTLGVHGSASHNYNSATDNADVNITVAGVGITVFDLNNTVSGSGLTVSANDINTATALKLGSGITLGDLVEDLKTNPAASPNYANYGPLYTLRNAGTGYDVRAILKATTELDTNTSSAIAWDSIDITRNESEWFLNNEFNLFNINHNAGYWVYLENKSADTVSIVSATFTPSAYTYYFSNAAGLATTNIMNSGQISVTITGLDDTVASSAYLTVGGEDVALTRTGTTNIFTADVSTYALREFIQNQTGPIYITVRAVNGKGQAVSASGVVSIDFAAPVMTTPVASGATSITLGATGTPSNFYVFSNNIPEVESVRTAAIVKTLPATASAATFNACSEFTFGTTNILRIVAADGALNSSNVSDAKEVTYASALRGATVLTHTQGVGLKSQIGSVYSTACVNTATQTLPSENAGVSLAALATGATARMSFTPITNANFTQDVAWTANYEITGGAGAVVQIQNVVAYAGDTFFVEYNGAIYRGTFPATQIAADASIAAPIDLTAITGTVNTSLVP
ncbi:MAG: hypothetical protein Q7S59_06220 [Sulfurimonas sp.]|nr:hypothetical protein [Sulfurimonas sp.]